MKHLPHYKKSLSAKLVLAFILVAVPSMLVASKVATELVSHSVNMNIEHWLNGVSKYVFLGMEETVKELAAVHVLLYPRFVQPRVAFTAEELEAMSDLGADVILLRDAADKILFSGSPAVSLSDIPLYPGSLFRWGVMDNGKEELAIVLQRTVTAWDGTERTLQLASWLSIQISESGSDEMVALRILLPDGEGFRQVYASSGSAPYVMPPEAARAISTGAEEYFIPDEDWTDDTPNVHFLLKTLRDAQGDILAVFAVSAIMLPLGGWMPSSNVLFWGFFMFGTALSGSIGYMLARRLVRPVRLLNKGVQRIAAGDLGCQVEVKGADEVAELGAGFNLMSKQLEIMRHENIQSARRERSRMLGEIALGFAHEIRNPLVVIKTSAELVQTRLPHEAKESRLLGFVVEEVGRIDRLISEFLAFAKPGPLKFEYFDLDLLLRDVVEISAAEFSRRGITCSITNETLDGKVLGEQNQIRQVLLNLILNAMDAMPEGGSLSLRLYETEAASRVCLEVADTGAGIAEELLRTMHLPFVSTKKNGLGLGLPKAYAIIEEHGGSIACASSLGEGTTFTIGLNR